MTTEAQRFIGSLCRVVGAAQGRLDHGEAAPVVAQVLALQVAALAVSHAPAPAGVVAQVGATAAGVVRVPVVGSVVEGGRVVWGDWSTRMRLDPGRVVWGGVSVSVVEDGETG